MPKEETENKSLNGKTSPPTGTEFYGRYNSLQVLRGEAFHSLTAYSKLLFYGIFTRFIGKYYFFLMTGSGREALNENLLNRDRNMFSTRSLIN